LPWASGTPTSYTWTGLWSCALPGAFRYGMVIAGSEPAGGVTYQSGVDSVNDCDVPSV
jgi:hypothetical protein